MGMARRADESRDWENVYRSRWQYDKIVRSTHGVNCTGSCSWRFYVKNGLVTSGKPSKPTILKPARLTKPRTTRLPSRRKL